MSNVTYACACRHHTTRPRPLATPHRLAAAQDDPLTCELLLYQLIFLVITESEEGPDGMCSRDSLAWLSWPDDSMSRGEGSGGASTSTGEPVESVAKTAAAKRFVSATSPKTRDQLW